MKYIDADRLKAKLDEHYRKYQSKYMETRNPYTQGLMDALDLAEQVIDSLQQEQPHWKPSESEDEKIRKELIEAFEAYDIESSWNGFPVKSILAYLEKQKEQDNEEGDFTIYHPQKNGEGKYKCIPFSFYGSLTSFSNDKDLMDFLNECFYDKEECERWCEIENKPELPECKHKIKKDSVFDYLCESSDDKKQKEQKPAQTSEEKEYIRTLKSLISDFIRDKQPEDVAFYQKMYDWLDGRHIEQKSAEWSEEDEEMLNSCISSIEESKENRYAYKETDGDTSYDREVDWLKSLRPQPQWKPSEEQMNELFHALIPGAEYDCDILEELYFGLKSWLDSIRERPEQK